MYTIKRSMDEPILELDSIKTKGVFYRDVFDLLRTDSELNAKILVQDECDLLHCSVDDNYFRPHNCVISFTYPSTYVIIDSSLFQIFDKIHYTSLQAAVTAFKSTCNKLAPFFETIDIIDNNFVVVNPPQLKYKQCHRTVCIDSVTSWVCTVSPQGTLQDMYIQTPRGQLDMPALWDHEKSIVENYNRIFGFVDFSNTQSCSSIDLECSICFSKESSEIGMTKCLQSNCSAYYHYECICDWFKACNQEMCLGEISGKCPKCETSMSVSKMPTNRLRYLT